MCCFYWLYQGGHRTLIFSHCSSSITASPLYEACSHFFWKIRSFGDLRHFQRSIRIRVEAIPLFQAEGGPTEASSILILKVRRT